MGGGLNAGLHGSGQRVGNNVAEPYYAAIEEFLFYHTKEAANRDEKQSQKRSKKGTGGWPDRFQKPFAHTEVPT